METKTASKRLVFAQVALWLLFASVLFPSNIKSVAIGLFALSSIIHFICAKNQFNARFFIINASVFIVIVVTLLYSDNTAYGVRKLTTFLSLVIFPLCFALYSREDIWQLYTKKKTYLFTYVISVVLMNVLPFIWFLTTHYSFDEMLIHFPTLMGKDIGKFNIHPIYLSMHCAVAIVFSLFLFNRNAPNWKNVLIILLDIILVLFLLVYAKKGPIMGLVLISLLYILFQRKSALKKPYIIAVISLIALVLIIPNTRTKFIELQKIEKLDSNNVTSTNIRYTIYTIASELIIESPLVGYGVGDYLDKLKEKYNTSEYEYLKGTRYNAHNQYLSFLLIGGVMLLIVFMCFLAINLIYAIRFNNELFIIIILFYGFVMLTENILERESGVIYFALFLNFLSVKSLFYTPNNAS